MKANYNDFVKIFFADLADRFSDRVKMEYYQRYIASPDRLASFIMEVELPTIASEAA